MNSNNMTHTEKGFLYFTDDYGTHLPMLLLALQQSEGGVIELGSGEYSTGLLRKYCEENNRKFTSYDYNEDWALKTGSIWTKDWDKHTEWIQKCGLLFVDHSPGNHRWKAMIKMYLLADIIVVHDSEEVGAGDYHLRRAWPYFKYRLNYNRMGPGAGASMVSNKIDVTKFNGDFYGYRFE